MKGLFLLALVSGCALSFGQAKHWHRKVKEPHVHPAAYERHVRKAVYYGREAALPYNLTGTWQREDGATLRIAQSGNAIEARFVNIGPMGAYHVVPGDISFTGTLTGSRGAMQVRVYQADGSPTTISTRELKIVSPSKIEYPVGRILTRQ